jgi:hypothetical protein
MWLWRREYLAPRFISLNGDALSEVKAAAIAAE